MEAIRFSSRRSVVHSAKGIAASTQPLASAAAVRILEKGGNAAMAAVAMAAAMSVSEPMMTGLGGDAFALLYDAKSKTVRGVNGCGKAPKNGSIDAIRQSGVKGPRLPSDSVHSVTVPAAVATWVEVVEKWGNGKLTMAEILEPAIQLAEQGTPISSITRAMWKHGVARLKKNSPNGGELLVDGERAPAEGEIFVNKNMAETLKRIAKYGKDGYYKGPTADAIVEVIKERGGLMTHEDLADVEVLFCDPIYADIDEDIRLHELPPNNQGLVALIAIGTINELERQGKISRKSLEHNSVEYLHLLAETLKFAFKDGEEYITDIGKLDYDPQDFMDPAYLKTRASLFSPDKVNKDFDYGVLDPTRKSDTSYFTVSDSEGNACSFIASLYLTFGSAMVPKGTGFALHCRGSNFNLTPGTRNCYEAGKRPYHTIIPAMITNRKDDSLYCSYGVMGGFMQPQGHVQVALNMKLFGMNPQEALDAPRLCLYADPAGPDSGLGADSPVSTPETILGLEEGISENVAEGLRKLGHKVKIVTGAERGLFGRGQVIAASKDSSGRLLWSAGSDLRGDGHAQPQLY